VHHADSKFVNGVAGSGGPGLRRKKKYRVVPSPLVCLRWWRVCIDEAHMVENTTAETAKMALRIPAQHRWCVSGTPIGKGSIEDLYGLLLFLKASPLDQRQLWTKVVRDPINQRLPGAMERLIAALRLVMWRVTKASVAEQVEIPTQVEVEKRLRFSSVEAHFYRKQHSETAAIAARLAKGGGAGALEKMFKALIKLRQACCHPSIGSGGIQGGRVLGAGARGSIQGGWLTMDQILDRLIDEERLKAEEAQRIVLLNMNASAAIERLVVELEDRRNLKRRRRVEDVVDGRGRGRQYEEGNAGGQLAEEEISMVAAVDGNRWRDGGCAVGGTTDGGERGGRVQGSGGSGIQDGGLHGDGMSKGLHGLWEARPSHPRHDQPLTVECWPFRCGCSTPGPITGGVELTASPGFLRGIHDGNTKANSTDSSDGDDNGGDNCAEVSLNKVIDAGKGIPLCWDLQKQRLTWKRGESFKVVQLEAPVWVKFRFSERKRILRVYLRTSHPWERREDRTVHASERVTGNRDGSGSEDGVECSGQSRTKDAKDKVSAHVGGGIFSNVQRFSLPPPVSVSLSPANPSTVDGEHGSGRDEHERWGLGEGSGRNGRSNEGQHHKWGKSTWHEVVLSDASSNGGIDTEHIEQPQPLSMARNIKIGDGAIMMTRATTANMDKDESNVATVASTATMTPPKADNKVAKAMILQGDEENTMEGIQNCEGNGEDNAVGIGEGTSTARKAGPGQLFLELELQEAEVDVDDLQVLHIAHNLGQTLVQAEQLQAVEHSTQVLGQEGLAGSIRREYVAGSRAKQILHRAQLADAGNASKEALALAEKKRRGGASGIEWWDVTLRHMEGGGPTDFVEKAKAELMHEAEEGEQNTMVRRHFPNFNTLAGLRIGLTLKTKA
ncbi:unnamed protein product, partial [Choristocarpus tenellus]